MPGSQAAAGVPTWIVEVTRHRDLSREALELALEHMGGRTASIVLVHVMSEVPTSRNMTLPASEVDPKTALQHAKKLVDILMKPLLAVAKTSQVECGTVVELNDRRDMGLCLAARRANAERVYVGVKRKLLGWSSSAILAACQTSLPRTCALFVSQGGRGHKHQQLQGAQRTDLSAQPSVFLQFHSAPSAHDALTARLAPPAIPPASPSSLKPPAPAPPLHVRRPSDPPLDPSASPLGSSGAPSSEFSLSSSSSGPHSRSLPLAAPAPAPAPAPAASGGEAGGRDPWGQEAGGGGAEQRRAAAGGDGGRPSRLSFSTMEELQQMARRVSEAGGAQPLPASARHLSPGVAGGARDAAAGGAGEGGTPLWGAGRGPGMGLSLSATSSPSATPAPAGGAAMGGGGEEGRWGRGHAVRKRSAERVGLPEGIPEEGEADRREGGGAQGEWDAGEEEGEAEGGGPRGRSLLADELAMLEAEDEGGTGEGAGEGGDGAAWVSKGVSSNREADAEAAGADDSREPPPALSPAATSPLPGSSSLRGSARSPGGSSGGGSRHGSRQGSMQGSIGEGVGGGMGAMSGGGSVGAGSSSGNMGLLALDPTSSSYGRPNPASSSSSSSTRGSRFHHLSQPPALSAYSQGPAASLAPSASSFGRSAFSSGQLTPGSGGGGGGDGYDCRQFTAAQLARATGNYAEENLLGRGSFGQVFKGEMLGCKVAVKRLEGQGWQGPDEFRVEVEVLSRMRHPNIVLLMGCCVEEMALVYEFLPGGTLQDKLGPPKTADAVRLSWSDRLRIASEMATALMYLHRNDPPIVHRDLKPDNILLDGNLSSKIGDVGLARLLEADGSTTMKVRGTLGYIDPEEVETCEISVLSDVYALGLILLQLLTGQKNVKAVHRMLAECTKAAKKGSAAEPGPGGAPAGAVGVVVKYLESTGGEWRMDLAEEAAGLAVRCADRRREKRPSLKKDVQPALVRLAAAAEEEVKQRKKHSDSQFICPLSKEVMRDPVVAGDGFTYEREHIEHWMATCTLSPSTGQPLPHTCLTPNNVLKTLIASHKLR
ncbi:hypothetical protein CLOM_g15401 [Closterium sp. NIES-68]|nr:hypothetical protein CLOM_g15401 [Closterium sp. NIES-68]